ncbi:hypothetical protein H4Q26_003795 [Puccinia striiformis f. sp. tritici PST-130]|nr:hypothetical protein H4Q26_003795 [Puccinia striiformis f. sp. tritici PST-130]
MAVQRQRSEWSKLLEGVFKQQWAAQRAFQADHTDAEEARMRKMLQYMSGECSITNPRIFRATESEVRDLINAIEQSLKHSKKTSPICWERICLTVMSKNAKCDFTVERESRLFVQAVHLRAERQPVLDTKTGPRLGTKLEEKIFKAQNDRKPAVMKMITEYNVQYSEYKSTRSDVGENDLLSYKGSVQCLWMMRLERRIIYHSDAPWAIDANGVDEFQEITLVKSTCSCISQGQGKVDTDGIGGSAQLSQRIIQGCISGDPVNDNDDNWEDEILVAVAEDGEDADVVASNVEDEGHD